ncbi:unnamed protein product [Linum tenue]|uniref:Uncharacterized protein n=1 Tax=Linum tenue TaxID=586396 RepID=A0AAV0PFD5_9ROSI|nr:unnamed protein product [Linum tenue]
MLPTLALPEREFSLLTSPLAPSASVSPASTLRTVRRTGVLSVSSSSLLLSSLVSRLTPALLSLLEPTVRPPPRDSTVLLQDVPSTTKLVPGSPSGVLSSRSARTSRPSWPSTRMQTAWPATPSSARRTAWCPLSSPRSSSTAPTTSISAQT